MKIIESSLFSLAVFDCKLNKYFSTVKVHLSERKIGLIFYVTSIMLPILYFRAKNILRVFFSLIS